MLCYIIGIHNRPSLPNLYLINIRHIIHIKILYILKNKIYSNK